jgi:hypothetical protein
MMMPTLAHAGQAVGRLSVGIRIVATGPTAAAQSTAGTATPAKAPFRRLILRESANRKIQLTEF